ncbi:AEC family transporter [Paralimibaculum aggregatum]|uniref:AEC family transporter n=1 Tax=Paralimibaculum aggregatum TaxID=3036245 RepID=A0ABQ6LI02_9RHOB|nr:AEC family transporter [Limibaculum sp. NKW23]GMG82922.1 AEC family transporter [Limibaculum sp. NKW23]
MLEIVSLIIPFFGLIAIGFATARIKPQPIEALAWLNIFIVYIALPALFIKLLATTPVEDLTNWSFVLTTVGVTFGILAFTFAIALVATGGNIAEATVQGLAGGYGNIGYMGPGLAILAFGEQAAVPVALIFCFENMMHFALAPAMMAMSGARRGGIGQLVLDVIAKIALHPFILATAVGVGLAFADAALPDPVQRLIDYLAQAAAPCALFAMGVTLALRPVKRVPLGLVYIVPIKLVLHPAAMFVALSMVGGVDPAWMLTAVLLASLPTATNVFVIAQQYGVWIERASATVLATTVLSVATVSVLLYALKAGYLSGGGIAVAPLGG